MNQLKHKICLLPCLACLLCLCVIDATPVWADDFPKWMDEVEFKSGARFELHDPAAPVDPETGQAANLETSKSSRSFKPKLPDFSKLREKAIKATIEQKASDSLRLQSAISFSEKNHQKLLKSRDDLQELLKTITDPLEKQRLSKKKLQLEQKLGAVAQLLQLIGSENGDLSGKLSQLSESDFQKALQLQRMIFSPPSAQKTAPKRVIPAKKADPARQFYKPTRNFKSFFIESKRKAAQTGEQEQ